MTLDELKREMEALTARIDEPLAEEIQRAPQVADEPWTGQAFSVDVILPRDKSALPKSGYRIHLSVGAWFVPASFIYTDR
jgi:hypothetical protein